jgi:hypothetical protein
MLFRNKTLSFLNLAFESVICYKKFLAENGKPLGGGYG